MSVAETNCRHCLTPGPHKVAIRESGPHYAEVRCDACDRHLGFLPKPDSDPTKYKRLAAHTDLVKKFSKGYCELCLKKLAELAKPSTLNAHHVVEYQDGGSNERENIWIVCTGCHTLIHWQRTYHGPRQALRERSAAIANGELPQPEQQADETDEQYLERMVQDRRRELQ